jgi:hypothetical protein
MYAILIKQIKANFADRLPPTYKAWNRRQHIESWDYLDQPNLIRSWVDYWQCDILFTRTVILTRIFQTGTAALKIEIIVKHFPFYNFKFMIFFACFPIDKK